MVVVLAFTR